jgi:hypothetical protein
MGNTESILFYRRTFMLSQLKHLSLEAEGRYASDAELQFMADYIQSFNLRVQTYQKLQELETTLLQQTYIKMKSIDPTFFVYNKEDASLNWKRDTTLGLRYAAIAVLTNDPEQLQDRLLFWFQTIIRAFGLERSYNATYQTLQEVVKQHLTPPQSSLICPWLELIRRSSDS